MKTKLSISMDEEKVSRIEQIVAQGKFRNKSHIIEYALNEYLKRDNHEG
ncbi:MAG TPA: ribbon-helix-helix domain-containing protein [Candidatus Nanoarchaeia archaeon]|nr:ribbon-helix-helix domain-containing protein [Candidatus Nanoarchaeia archaeon]